MQGLGHPVFADESGAPGGGLLGCRARDGVDGRDRGLSGLAPLRWSLIRTACRARGSAISSSTHRRTVEARTASLSARPAVTCRRTVKPIRSMAGPGRVVTSSAAVRMGAWWVARSAVDLLVRARDAARAQDPAVEHGLLEREAGDFHLPPAVGELCEFTGRIVLEIEQAGDQPSRFAPGAAVGGGEGDPCLDHVHRQRVVAAPGQVGAVGQAAL